MKRKSIFWPIFGVASGLAVIALWKQRNSNGPNSAPNQAIYRLYAPIYDRLFGPIYARARWRSIELLSPRTGESLLIPGVGTGLDLQYIPKDVQVTGVDISQEMIAKAVAKARSVDARFLLMDAQKLDFADESFDAVLLNLIVSVAPDGNAVFREAWRVVKPGGRVVIFDKFAPEGGTISPIRRLVGGVARIIGTDVNRTISSILQGVEGLTIELNEPSVFYGQYRILILRKPKSEKRVLVIEKQIRHQN